MAQHKYCKVFPKQSHLPCEHVFNPSIFNALCRLPLQAATPCLSPIAWKIDENTESAYSFTRANQDLEKVLKAQWFDVIRRLRALLAKIQGLRCLSEIIPLASKTCHKARQWTSIFPTLECKKVTNSLYKFRCFPLLMIGARGSWRNDCFTGNGRWTVLLQMFHWLQRFRYGSRKKPILALNESNKMHRRLLWIWNCATCIS